jgi:hypothetical protein
MAAPAATVTASSTVKASTTMKAFAAMKASATMGAFATAKAFATAVAHAAVAGMVRPVVGAVIEVVVVVSFMTLPTTKVTPIAKVPPIAKVTPVTVLSTFKVTKVIKIMVEVAKEAKWGITHEEGGIETPAERAVEDSVSRNVGVTAVIRIPIPAGAVPAAQGIVLSPIDVSFGGIRRPQAAPAVEIVLGLFFVEFLGFRRTAVAERDLTIALDLDIPVHLPNGRLALEHTDEIVICVKVVQTGLEQTHSVAVQRDDEIISLMKLRDFDGRAAFVQPKFRVGQTGRNHGYGAVVTEPQEGTRRQKNLRFTNLSIKRLTRLQFGRTYRFAVEDLACDRDLSFDVIYTSWACRVCAISGRERSRNQDEACNSFQHWLPHVS